jgi:hypothetical protein
MIVAPQGLERFVELVYGPHVGEFAGLVGAHAHVVTSDHQQVWSPLG